MSKGHLEHRNPDTTEVQKSGAVLIVWNTSRMLLQYFWMHIIVNGERKSMKLQRCMQDCRDTWSELYSVKSTAE